MNNPFDRMNIGLRERPLSSDLNRMQSQHDRTVRELMRAIYGARSSDTSSANASRTGFIGDGLKVVPVSPAAMQVQVNAGYGFIYDPTDVPSDIGATDLEGVDDLSPYKPVFLISPHTFSVPAAPAGPNTRIDIIEVKVDRRLENSLTRRQLDVATKAFLDHSFYKTMAFALDGRTGQVTSPAVSTAGLSYKVGVAGNPGVVPATTPGYVKIAEILVGSAVTSITMAAGTGGMIVDRRVLLGPGGTVRASVQWRQQWNAGTPIVTLLSVCAPPGVEVAVSDDQGSTGNHNQGTIWVLAGEATKGTCVVTGHTGNPVQSNIYAKADRTNNGILGSNPFAVTSGLNTVLTHGGLSAAIGAKIVSASYLALDAAASATNASLDDIIWHAHFQIGYH